MVGWRDLVPSASNENDNVNKVLRSRGSVVGGTMESDRVLDYRGKTVEEVMDQIEGELDAASVAGEDRLRVIHGHGTESLKKALRSYFSRSHYVKSWTAGKSENGGDGVTWVYLK
jgi:DNA mismatch repair protein MutS2